MRLSERIYTYMTGRRPMYRDDSLCEICRDADALESRNAQLVKGIEELKVEVERLKAKEVPDEKVG